MSNKWQTTTALSGGTWAWQLRLPLAVLLVLLLALGIMPPTIAQAASCAVTSPANSGAGTLRARLADNACDTITFQDGLGPITLANGLALDRTVTVEGPGQVVQYTGTPSANGYVMMVTGGTVTLRGLTLQGGRTINFSGAGLSVSGGDVALDGVTVRDNRADGAGGGGIYVTDATLRLNDTVVEGNSSPGSGGMFIDNTFGNVAVTIAGGSQIVGNQATVFHGGGILISQEQPTYRATLTMTDSTIGTRDRPNVADQFGGGLWNYGGTVSLTNVSIVGNIGQVGGIVDGGGTTTLTNVLIEGNKGTDIGGYLLDSGTATLTNVTISDNHAIGGDGQGGGFYNHEGVASLTNVSITGNTAQFDGGGFYNRGGTSTLTNTTISGNAAGEWGGGLVHIAGTTTLRFVTVTDNTADKDVNGSGANGGLGYATGALNVTSSIIAGNRRGAAIPNDCGDGITSQGYNLVGSATGCPSNGTGDLVLTGALATVLQPTLAANGGASRTHALVPNSPAIDRVPLAQCAVTTDQRGVFRPQSGLCDIGAVEGAVAPAPSSGQQVAMTVSIVGGGSVERDPRGEGDSPFVYDVGTTVTLTAKPDDVYTFVGWSVDGVNQGWANPLTITMNADYKVQAIFALTASFSDVGPGRGDHAAIVALATRRTIRGYGDGTFGPDDTVQRAQMAALIARATPAGPGTPPTMLTPPACLVAGTWDCEDWGNNFTDQGGVDANLWRNAGTLQHYGVALGYGADQCAAKGQLAPCFGPNDPVSYAQTISFITRAMVAKGYWVAQPGAPQPYNGVPAAHQPDVQTFHYYTGGIPAPPTNWDAPATRGWFAQALWAALDSYWSVDRVP